MDILDDKEVCELIEIEESKEFDELMRNFESGIKIIPTTYGNIDQKVVKAEAGPFSKWIRKNHSEINVDLPADTQKLILRSDDFWMCQATIRGTHQRQLKMPIILGCLMKKSYLAVRWYPEFN